MLGGMTTRPAPPGDHAAAAPPRLLLVAHGTRSSEGRREICRLLLEVRKRLRDGGGRPGPDGHPGHGVDCRLAWVDVQSPAPGRVLADGVPTVVVPAFLARGHHVIEDVGGACAAAPGPVALTDHLGADPEVVRALVQRLAEAGGVGASGADAVVLGAAGSRDAASRAETAALAETLEKVLRVPVTPAFASAAEPSVADAVAAAREAGNRRVAVATHLLAPGFFADRMAAAGADIVSTPLGAHPEIVSLVVRRYSQNVPIPSGVEIG